MEVSCIVNGEGDIEGSYVVGREHSIVVIVIALKIMLLAMNKNCRKRAWKREERDLIQN
jgi:hypothetical protein